MKRIAPWERPARWKSFLAGGSGPWRPSPPEALPRSLQMGPPCPKRNMLHVSSHPLQNHAMRRWLEMGNGKQWKKHKACALAWREACLIDVDERHTILALGSGLNSQPKTVQSSAMLLQPPTLPLKFKLEYELQLCIPQNPAVKHTTRQ